MSVNAYNYIEQNHPKLWLIESNATYRGWFVGGIQEGEWNNREFVTKHIAGHGSLGDYFASQLKGTIKMGDTPSVARLLLGESKNPEKPSWGGKYVRIWDGRKTVFPRSQQKTTRPKFLAWSSSFCQSPKDSTPRLRRPWFSTMAFLLRAA